METYAELVIENLYRLEYVGLFDTLSAGEPVNWEINRMMDTRDFLNRLYDVASVYAEKRDQKRRKWETLVRYNMAETVRANIRPFTPSN